MESDNKHRQTKPARRAVVHPAVALAAALALPAIASATVTPGGGFPDPVVYNVSTAGATAIGNFNSMNGNQYAMTLGQNASLQIGRSVYDLNGSGQAQRLGAFNIQGGSTDPELPHDRMAYYYHQTGSIEGILELADTYGLNAALAVRKPTDPTSANPTWVMGNRINGINYNNFTNAVDTGSQSFNGYLLGRNYRNTGAIDNAFRNSPSTATGDQVTTLPPGQDLVRIAWSDVKAPQAFGKGVFSSGAFNARPNTIGYGQGRGNATGSTTNFQKFRNETSLMTPTNSFGIDNFRSETIAVVPFAFTANPGTGLEIVSKTDLQWATTTGRLKNGANFNHSTRDVGSGTRNQFNNNIGVDPTWGAGERDRRHLGTSVATYNTLSTDGSQVTVNIGDEAAPTIAISGSSSSTELALENRAGARLRFADKTGGGNLKATVQASRMGFGILSTDNIGVDGKNGNSSLPGQVRALRLDSENGFGALQPKPDEVTGGKYILWSQGQAVTVKADPTVADTTAPGGRPIKNDTIDHAGSVGIHRKFIDNTVNSVGDFPVGNTAVTPADGILNSGFILPQFMQVTKNFDGDAYGSRTRTPEQDAVYQQYKTAAASPGGFLDLADPAAVPGYSGNIVKYEIYSYNNTALASTANSNKSIVVNQRLALAGDFNNDQVRDIGDVADMARARVNPTGYVAGPTGWAANSVISGKSGNPVLAPEEGLLVLSDFDGDGNFLSLDAATTSTEPVAKADVRWFLYGSAIDTSDTAGNAALAAAYASSDAAGMTLDRKRRVFGVRIGDLKKNAAIDTYNTTIQSLVGTVVAGGPYAGLLTQAQADSEKINKHDVDNDGFADAYDAVIVDRNNGKNYTTMSDVLGTSDDLIAAELDDNKVIDAADVTVMNTGLTGIGKTNWRGGVLEKSGPGNVTIARSAGAGSEVTLPAGGQTLRISSGSFSAGGTADPFTDSVLATRHVNVENNSSSGSGGFHITAGSKSIGTLIGTGTSSVSAGATLTADYLRQNTLTANGTVSVRQNGGSTSVINTLVIGAAGKLDLADNKLITSTAPGIATASVYSGLQGEVQRAYDFNAWDQPGLSTSMPDAVAGLTTIGIATGGQVRGLGPTETDTFAGQTITGASTIAMYTYAGDANLDGVIDGGDYGTIDNFVQVPGADGYANGDFNYDGVIDGGDYGIIDNNIQAQGAPFSTSALGLGGSGLAAVTAVPEPATAGLILTATGISLTYRHSSRRRRRA